MRHGGGQNDKRKLKRKEREKEEDANCEGGRDKGSHIQHKITGGYGGGGKQNQGQRVTLTLSHLIFSFKGCVFPTDFHVEYQTALCFSTKARHRQRGGE